ncbi:MAG: radical SAM protein [Candidatus Hodarchaeota archaeon]
MVDKFIYGPFSSRRLGLSLGINLLGNKKKCTYNCVYCEIGRSTADEIVGINYRYSPDLMIDEFEKEISLPLKNLPEIDSATFGYMGETTLAAHLEEYHEAAKKIRKQVNCSDGGPKLSIFTNSSTLDDENMRKILAKFDFVMAKLDCGSDACFKKVNRPHASVPDIAQIVENLVKLRKEIKKYPSHKFAIQTLIFKSMNSAVPSNMNSVNLERLADHYNTIEPDIVQIYTVARQPAEKGIHAISFKEKKQLLAFFTGKLKESIEIKVY